MPPKVRFSREQIVQAAYEMVRRGGIDVLTARGLAEELGTSTAPLFTAFHSVEEIRDAVIQKAKATYQQYFDRGLEQPIPFKGLGMQYVLFAKDEPRLFQLLFMQAGDEQEPSHFLPEKDEHSNEVLALLEREYHMDRARARTVYNHLSVYTHGLAMLFALGQCVFTMDDISRMLRELYMALTKEDTYEQQYRNTGIE